MILDTAYALVGPDGTRIVVGNSDAAVADADWIGYLDAESGIVGLDGPDLRESAVDLVGADGGLHYDFFHGRRPVAINAAMHVALENPTTIPLVEQKVKRATNAVRDDAVLSWTDPGFVARRLHLRRQQPPRFPGRRPKAVQLAMVDADYRILSDAEASTAAANINATVVAANLGDEVATPRWEVDGQTTAGLRFRNLTTGLEVKVDKVLDPSDELVVDLAPPYPSVTLNGDDAYQYVDYTATTWAGLEPGNNSLKVESAGAATWRVYWRHAWI